MHHSHTVHVLAGFGSDIAPSMKALGVTHPISLQDPIEDPHSVFVALVVTHGNCPKVVGYTKRVGPGRDEQREQLLARTLFDQTAAALFFK